MAAKGYVTRDEIARAKEIDLETYLRAYEPEELVKCGKGYRTRTHDSLKISNGLWHWHSRGIGGRTALDYLIHVKGMDFVPAVQLLSNELQPALAESVRTNPKPQAKPFALPPRNGDDSIVTMYLMRRGVHFSVIARCLENGTLYESWGYHNAVFVGRDAQGAPRYAMLRATDGGTFKIEAEGSDKRFSFSMPGTDDTLMVTESAIDALSVATLLCRHGMKWRSPHYLSLGGISEKMSTVPKALVQYLNDHPSIRQIHLMLDNDKAGREAARHIAASLGESYDVKTAFPAHGKDFNDEARWMAEHTERQQEQRKTR